MPKNILIVDDEEDICDFLVQLVGKLGHQAEFALSGEQALEWIEKKKWDAAIVDLKLSTSITGLDVIRAFHTKSPGTLVAAMTGYVDVGLRQEAERLGVSDYFKKPDDVLPDVFTDKFNRILARIERPKQGS